MKNKSLLEMIKKYGVPSKKRLTGHEQDEKRKGYNQANAEWRKLLESITIDEEKVKRIIRSNIYKKEVPQAGKVKIRGYGKSASAITQSDILRKE